MISVSILTQHIWGYSYSSVSMCNKCLDYPSGRISKEYVMPCDVHWTSLLLIWWKRKLCPSLTSAKVSWSINPARISDVGRCWLSMNYIRIFASVGTINYISHCYPLCGHWPWFLLTFPFYWEWVGLISVCQQSDNAAVVVTAMGLWQHKFITIFNVM